MRSDASMDKQAEYYAGLILRVADKKDRDAFAALFDYFAPRVKSFLMKHNLPPETAEELAQETMINLWQKARQFDPTRAAASTWVFTIARNKRIDFLRKAQSAAKLDTDQYIETMAEAPAPDAILHAQQNADAVRDALQGLPDDQAELLQKAFFEGKTHMDIANETKIPLGTIKSRIRLALEKMKKSVQKENHM